MAKVKLLIKDLHVCTDADLRFAISLIEKESEKRRKEMFEEMVKVDVK